MAGPRSGWLRASQQRKHNTRDGTVTVRMDDRLPVVGCETASHKARAPPGRCEWVDHAAPCCKITVCDVWTAAFDGGTDWPM